LPNIFASHKKLSQYRHTHSIKDNTTVKTTVTIHYRTCLTLK